MAPKTYGAEDARTRLPELLQKAHEGTASLITRHGKPYAALVPADEVRLKRQSILQLRGSSRGLWGKHPAQAVKKMRDEWQ